MCGRYTNLYKWKQIHKLAELTTLPLEFEPSYNVAPTQRAPVVRQIGEERRLDLLRWGLIPSWAKDEKIGNSLINARADSVATKPAYRSAFKARRCLIPASGFYEWQKVDAKRKQPHHVTLASGEPMFFAGLWERWKAPNSPEAEWLESYAILTTDANDLMKPIHDRMPVILDPSDFSAWLDAKSQPDALAALLRPCPPDKLARTPVATLVNNPRNNQPDCIAPLAG